MQYVSCDEWQKNGKEFLFNDNLELFFGICLSSRSLACLLATLRRIELFGAHAQMCENNQRYEHH